MITLYTFGPAFGLPDPSPFVMKAMALLKMAGQPYTCEVFGGGPNIGPKGKRPFILDDGFTVSDSTLIRFHLEQKFGLDLDAHLTPAQRGVTWAIEKMCEEHLYFAAVHFRWMVDENFQKGPAHFFDSVPALIRPWIRTMARKKASQMLHAQGLGRHTEVDITRLAGRDIDALAQVLGDTDWLGGAMPCAADASAGAFVLACLCAHFDTPLRAQAQAHPQLQAYAQRVLDRWFT